MKTNRIKVPLPTLTTRDQAESAMTALAAQVNDQRILTALRDDEILAINVRYEANLAKVSADIKQHTDALRAWAEASPDQFPKDRKSIQLTSGTLGFRIGNPKLALLSRAFNWDRVVAQIEAYWPEFLRLKKEVDKEAVLSMHSQATDKTVADAELKRLGLKVTQDETFFIEPDLTQFDTRVTK